MKKLTSVCLVLLMLLSLLGVTATAAESVTFQVQTVNVAQTVPAGTTFDVTVSVKNATELCAMELKLYYDKAQLKAVSATKEGLLTKLDQAEAVIGPADPVTDSAVYGEVWLTGMSIKTQKAQANEVISTITFEALTDLSADVVIAACADPVASNDVMAYKELTATCENGGVVFGGETTTTTLPETVTTTTVTRVEDVPKDDAPNTADASSAVTVAALGLVSVMLIVLTATVKKRAVR